MKDVYKRLAAFFVVIGSLIIASTAQAQDVQLINDAHVEYTFGQQLTFIAKLSDAVSPVNVQVFFRPKGDTNTISGQAVLEAGQAIYTHDLTRQSMKAFTEIEYWFSATLPDGANLVSQSYSFFYEDNRFAWNSMQDAPFRVHWYDGDATFGQMILDVARSGLLSAQKYIEYPSLEQVDIYVYASGVDLRSSLQLAGLTMIAGHADPALGVMIVSLPSGPDQRMETGRQVPHELVHILLYHKLGLRYVNLPTWLNEGLASVNEEFPNPDYFVTLEAAAQDKTLLPMPQLCNGFPLDAANFYLSYAQSASFVRYLYETYGASKLESLISQYADGIACEIAPQTVFERDLTELDRAWKEKEFGYNNNVAIVSPLFPWLAIAVIILAPTIFILISAFRLEGRKKARG